MSRTGLVVIIVILLVVIAYLVYRAGYFRTIAIVTIHPTPTPTTEVIPPTKITPTVITPTITQANTNAISPTKKPPTPTQSGY